MPYNIEIREADELVFARLWGVVDNELFEDYISATEALSPVPKHYRLLLVFHEATRLSVDTSLIRELARRPAVFGPQAARVVVANEDLAFGLSRIFISESPSASQHYTIVRALSEAGEILGIDTGALTLAWR